MARPREFDMDSALTGAMDVFWAEGYVGAALPDLLDGMGITRGSLYKAFGDKKSLFTAVLRRFEVAQVDPAISMLTDVAHPGADRVAALFEKVVNVADEGDRRGCMLCTAASGPAGEDAEIGDVVHGMLARMRAGFLVATGNADQADMLLTHYVGLRVMVRSGADTAALRAGTRAVVSALSSADKRD